MISPQAPSAYRGRLAPSPTGYLHLGHAATFLTARARTSASGGTLVLRLEDIDQERVRPEYCKALVEDMRWIGLEWQEGPDVGGPFGPYRQSERARFYLEIWRKLAVMGCDLPVHMLAPRCRERRPGTPCRRA